MKIVIIFLIHFILKVQNAEAKEIVPIKSYLTDLSQNQINAIYAIQSKELANFEINQLKSISDLRDKIKNSATNAWNAIKNIACKTKEKINLWLHNIKERAEEAVKAVQAKLEILKDKFNKFNKKIAGVKHCIQEDKGSIQEILKHIALNVATCIADKVKKADTLVSYQSKLTLDDTEFIKETEDKMNRCVQNVNDADECLNKARREIYDDMEQKETGIMDTRSISRDLVEYALGTIVQCAADGITKASEAIILEVIKIINCAASENKKPFLLN